MRSWMRENFLTNTWYTVYTNIHRHIHTLMFIATFVQHNFCLKCTGCRCSCNNQSSLTKLPLGLCLWGTVCIEGNYSPATSCHLILCATLLIKYDYKDLSPPCDALSSLSFFTLLYFKLKNWLFNCLAVKCFCRRCQDLSAVSPLPWEICLPCPWLINTIVMPAPYI